MSYKIKTTSVFERQVKRLIKKYPSLKKEIQILVEKLKENPEQGTSIGHNCFKIRLSIASKGKGKSGGSRIITHILYEEKDIYLLSIYDKSEIGNLTNEEVQILIKLIH